MSMVKRLEDICLDILIKDCNSDDYKLQSLYCYVDEFVVNVSHKVYLLCEYPNWQHKSEMNDSCDWYLFYKDICIYSCTFNCIGTRSKIISIVRCFYLFFRMIDY